MRPDDWMADGSCRDYLMDLWFPLTSWNEPTAVVAPEAVAICRQCPVRAECLTYSLENQVDGVWAATSPRDRDRLRKQTGVRAQPLIPTYLNPHHLDPTQPTGDVA